MDPLEVELEGRYGPPVLFYPDDTIGRVRELVAIRWNPQSPPHPDGLFIQMLVTLPEGYYSTPKEWNDLFLRLSRDGQTVSEEALRTYLSDLRQNTVSFPVRSYTRETWDAVPETEELRRSGGKEWQILGAKIQTVLPRSPKDVALPTNVLPLLAIQSLYETVHPLKRFPKPSAFRVTELPTDPSDAVLRAYFPRLRPDTPPNLESSKDSILAAQEHLGKLLALAPRRPDGDYSLTKVKWIVPLNATRFGTPRTQFEQIFYGLTVSKETPYIAYYTAESAALRSKFYVEDPKTKIPYLDTSALRSWYDETRPSRRRPTLLLYKPLKEGSTKAFMRIAITSIDIALEVRKEKGSKGTPESMRKQVETWFRSLDAVMPFLDERDLSEDRWEQTDMSLTAKYPKEETEFDLLRFQCLQSIFGEEGGTFRLLRTEQGPETVSRRIVDACQALNREGAVPTAEYLAEELSTTLEDATALLREIESGEINCDRVLRDYPTLRFSGTEVEVNFATDPDRVLRYADLLRYVLTLPNKAVVDICPRRGEAVGALSVVPQAPAVEEEVDTDLLELLGLSEEPAANAAPPPEPVKRDRKVKVAEAQTNTASYFNDRLKAFDAERFAPPYSKQCEKSNQVIVLTPEDKEAIRAKGPYTYETAPPSEQLEIPGGTAICPPYWCMTDEIPLREEDLIPDEDGQKRCPVCKGKVRPNDKVSTKEYPVINRMTSKGKRSPYPKFMKNLKSPKEKTSRENVPCCAPTLGRSANLTKETETAKREQRELYVLSEDVQDVTEYRVAQLSPDLATQLGVITTYDKTLDRSRVKPGATDAFRIGLGRPSKTIRRLLRDYQTYPKDEMVPMQNKDIYEQCSFSVTVPFNDFLAKPTPLQELEYLSFDLGFSVILVNTSASPPTVRCGFRTSGRRAYTSRVLVVFTSETTPSISVLGRATREADLSETNYSIDFLALLKNPETKPFFVREKAFQLFDLVERACAGETADASTAAKALYYITYVARTGLTDLKSIVDGLGQYQGYMASWTDTARHTIFLPFTATTEEALRKLSVPAEHDPIRLDRVRYHEIDEKNLPTYADQLAIFEGLANASKTPAFVAQEIRNRTQGATSKDEVPPSEEQIRKDIERLAMYAVAREHRNADGKIVEVETASGFRVPVQPTEPDPTKGPVTEVLDTVRRAESKSEGLKGEAVLLKASPDPEGKTEKAKIDYRAEVIEFLLMTLARDLQTNEYRALRVALSAVPVKDAESYRTREVLPRLTQWYTAEAYADDTASSYALLSKVRTPCGQLKDKTACNNASLCGWTGGPKKPCKVRVRSSLLKTDEVLTHLSKTLVENDKQRALVLDNRVSPFFSTVLYLEMPHEWITTSY